MSNEEFAWDRSGHDWFAAEPAEPGEPFRVKHKTRIESPALPHALVRPWSETPDNPSAGIYPTPPPALAEEWRRNDDARRRRLTEEHAVKAARRRAWLESKGMDPATPKLPGNHQKGQQSRTPERRRLEYLRGRIRRGLPLSEADLQRVTDDALSRLQE